MTGQRRTRRPRQRTKKKASPGTDTAGRPTATDAKVATAKSRKSDCPRLRTQYHGQRALRLAAPAQTKVTVGKPGDRYEREADDVADKVNGGQEAPDISRIPAGGLRSQSKEDPESAQETAVQREPDDSAPGQDEAQTQAEPAPDEGQTQAEQAPEEGQAQTQADGEEPADDAQQMGGQEQDEAQGSDGDTQTKCARCEREEGAQRKEESAESAQTMSEPEAAQTQSEEAEGSASEPEAAETQGEEAEGSTGGSNAAQTQSEDDTEPAGGDDTAETFDAGGDRDFSDEDEEAGGRERESDQTGEEFDDEGEQENDEDSEEEAEEPGEELGCGEEESEGEGGEDGGAEQAAGGEGEGGGGCGAESESGEAEGGETEEAGGEEAAEGEAESAGEEQATDESQEGEPENCEDREGGAAQTMSEDAAETATDDSAESMSDESAQTMSDEAAETATDESSQENNQDEAAQTRSKGSSPARQRDMGAIASQAIHSRGPGEPLAPNMQDKLEAGLGTDLRNVRVHTDSKAHEANTGLRAKAFAHKNHIWLGRGQSPTDVKLMAHEVTHTIQQGGVDGTRSPGTRRERAAERREPSLAQAEGDNTDTQAAEETATATGGDGVQRAPSVAAAGTAGGADTGGAPPSEPIELKGRKRPR